jgi:hypothetical protein
LIDEKIKLLDSTMPLIEAHYLALQPITNEMDEFQKVIQQKREKSIRSIIECNGEERIPALILKKWTSEWRQTADTRPIRSPFSDFLKLKLLAWAGIVDANSQDPQSQSSLALLSLQYDNNLEIYHFLVSKRNSKVDLRNKRDLVVADYSLDSGRLVSSGLQNEIREHMHAALNLLEQKEAIEQYRQVRQRSRVAKPPESVAASSSDVKLPQDKQKGKQRQRYSSSSDMWSKPPGLTEEKLKEMNNDEDDESKDRLNIV